MAGLAPIRVAPSGAYFETTDREPFLFIGPNDSITWPGLAGLYRRKGMESVESYLQAMADSGVTVLRLMLEYAHREHRYFEYPQPGRFNPAMVRLWDDLFARCEQVGIRVLLAPWDNFWMARRWKRHPYNCLMGGPCEGPHAFFTDEATFQATVRRFSFVIERWGGSGVIAAWDLFNEIHPHWGGTPQEQSAVITRLSDAIREAEVSAWGFTRPQTVSVFGPKPEPGYEEMIFAHPSLDFATTHIYEGAIDFPHDPVTPAVTMGRWVRYARERAATLAPRRIRPFMDSEHGPIHLFNDHRKYQSEAKDDQYEHGLIWAHLASGGAGSGMRWPARDPHVITSGMRASLASLSAFCRHVDWRHFTPRPEPADGVTSLRLDGATGIHLFACRDDHQAVAYLLRAHDPASFARGGHLVMPGVPPGSAWHLERWDTKKGVSAGCQAYCGDGEGALRIPLTAVIAPRQRDVAVVLRRHAEC
jgi:mannan endo-1,4-beta-mannosidase